MKTYNIEEDLSIFEVAKLAKEKEFNEVCTDSFDGQGREYPRYYIEISRYGNDAGENSEELKSQFEVKNEECKNGFIARPSNALLIKWLMIAHGIHLRVEFDSWNTELYDFSVNIKNNIIFDFTSELTYTSHAEATNEGLLYCLKLIKC